MRYELKLTAPTTHLPQVRSWLRLHPAHLRVAYPPRWVNNIYWDTADYNSFHANLMGISTRQKLRLRWYGHLEAKPSQPVLELKFKRNLLGGKWQIGVADGLDLQRPWRDIRRQIHDTLAIHPQREAMRDLLATAVQPTLLNRYKREYYAAEKVRVTLDYALELYDQRPTLRPNWTRPLPRWPQLVIEIKTEAGNEKDLRHMVAGFPVRRTRHSKYANGLLASFL